MPSLALAQKLLGKAGAVGVEPVAHSARGAEASPETEAELGDALLTLVASARRNGWDAERALRERLRLLERDIRAAEGGYPAT
jgi:XTP/dITP diphosphohydrolase